MGARVRYWGLTALSLHMSEDEIIHTEGERFDIRESDDQIYVYDKEQNVRLAYLARGR